ncbi:MAG TPA: hypothetical protein PKL64_07235, partial [Bacteroidales bacterium]|nr:hypothetical protein [Bacteroidales bacterium]
IQKWRPGFRGRNMDTRQTEKITPAIAKSFLLSKSISGLDFVQPYKLYKPYELYKLYNPPEII